MSLFPVAFFYCPTFFQRVRLEEKKWKKLGLLIWASPINEIHPQEVPDSGEIVQRASFPHLWMPDVLQSLYEEPTKHMKTSAPKSLCGLLFYSVQCRLGLRGLVFRPFKVKKPLPQSYELMWNKAIWPNNISVPPPSLFCFTPNLFVELLMIYYRTPETTSRGKIWPFYCSFLSSLLRKQLFFSLKLSLECV